MYVGKVPGGGGGEAEEELEDGQCVCVLFCFNCRCRANRHLKSTKPREEREQKWFAAHTHTYTYTHTHVLTLTYSFLHHIHTKLHSLSPSRTHARGHSSFPTLLLRPLCYCYYCCCSVLLPYCLPIAYFRSTTTVSSQGQHLLPSHTPPSPHLVHRTPPSLPPPPPLLVVKRSKGKRRNTHVTLPEKRRLI